jgi:homoserine kinase
MRKVKVVLPATVTDLGPGIHTLGLALALHATVEIIERGDDRFTVETSGEGAGSYSTGLRHPVILGLTRVFQTLERAPTGLTIRVDSRIPLSSGLGAEAAFVIAGVIGANNLFGSPFNLDQVLTLAAQACRRSDHAVTAILGGLTVSLLDGETLVYRPLPIQSMYTVVALPELDPPDQRPPPPDRASTADALFNLARLPLLIEALRSGDLALLASSLEDRLFAPARRALIPGYEQVVRTAKEGGASAVALCGGGPALIAFASTRHRQLADLMVTAFAEVDIRARAWVVPVDTQGVILSVAES